MTTSRGAESMLPVSISDPEIDTAIKQFLNRWMWKRDRAIAYRELCAILQEFYGQN